MPQRDLDAAIDLLYAAPLEAFVAERTRLAKELRGSGDRQAADEVAKLAKPSVAAWAINQLARVEPEAVDDWLASAATLREVSANAVAAGGETVRGATGAHRTATSELVALVRDRSRPGGRPLSETMVDRVRDLLRHATADADFGEQLRAGRLTGEPPPETAFEAPAAGPRRQRERERAPEPDPQEQRRAEAARRRAELEGRAQLAERELERLRADAERRQTAAEAAEARHEEAQRALYRRESEAAAAGGALADAREAVATAEQELERLRSLLRRDD